MSDFILNNYLLPLQNDGLKIIGVYRQGSDILGYSDKHSDKDYSIVWESKFPEKSKREVLIKGLELEIDFLADQEHKGTDKVYFNQIIHNLAHQLDYNFFKIYEELNTEKVNEPKLYILGGFNRGEIIYDPEGKLNEYKKTLIVTDRVKQQFNETRKTSTKNNIETLKIAADRKQPVEYIKSLNYLLITFSIQLYLQNGQFPMSPKWIEQDAIKYNWNNELLDTIKELKQRLPFEQAAGKLDEFSKLIQS